MRAVLVLPLGSKAPLVYARHGLVCMAISTNTFRLMRLSKFASLLHPRLSILKSFVSPMLIMGSIAMNVRRFTRKLPRRHGHERLSSLKIT